MALMYTPRLKHDEPGTYPFVSPDVSDTGLSVTCGKMGMGAWMDRGVALMEQRDPDAIEHFMAALAVWMALIRRSLPGSKGVMPAIARSTM
jgi:hypothetical protein